MCGSGCARLRLWLAALETLLGLYSAAGYGVAAIGENGTGLLDRLTWREDSPMTGTLSVFVYLIVFNDAAQVLAGEAVDDLAAALLPGPVLAAFFCTAWVLRQTLSPFTSAAVTDETQRTTVQTPSRSS